MHKKLLIIGAASGLLAVLLGAFGSHALKDLLAATGRVETYRTAVLYHMFHTLAILLTGLLSKVKSARLLSLSGLFFTGGILLFSGSLYALCMLDQGSLGAITPIGGLMFIAGWLLLIVYLWKN